MDLPDKTEKVKPVEKHITPVIEGGARQVKRPATRRFFDFLFAESPKKLGAKIGQDVIIPRMKAGMEEALNSFIHGMMWGEGASPASSMLQRTVLRGGNAAYTMGSQSAAQQAAAAASTRSTGNYQDLVVPSVEMAEVLLRNMYELLNQYSVVAVGDLYELAGITPAISDNSYGWKSLDGSRVAKVRDGYLLELPRPSLI